MVPFPIPVMVVLALTLLSASAAMAVALFADTKSKPAAAIVVRKLLEISLLGAAALIALVKPG